MLLKIEMHINLDIAKVCRTCLAEGGSLQSLVTNVRNDFGATDLDSDEMTIKELIISCAQITVYEHDGLPQSVCEQCVSDVRSVFAFKRRCEEADKKLRGYLLQQSIGSDVMLSKHALKEEINQELNDIASVEVDNFIDTQVDAYFKSSSADSSDVDADSRLESSHCDQKFLSNRRLHNKIVHIKGGKETSQGGSAVLSSESRSDPLSKLLAEIDWKKARHLDFGFRCHMCKLIFADRRSLSGHMRMHLPGTFDCYKCSMRFNCRQDRRMHYYSVHSKTKRKLMEDICQDNANVTNAYLKLKKRFECDLCKKIFTRKCKIRLHMKRHQPKSPKRFECDICKRVYMHKHYLIKHMVVHRAETKNDKRKLCVYCGNSFAKAYNLAVHMRRHTGDLPYKCDLCDKTFARNSGLKFHRRIHTKELPHRCTYCGKCFRIPNLLNRHVLIHTGVRPHKCTYTNCDRAFTQGGELKVHIRRHHTGEKPYACGICGQRFFEGSLLTQHRRQKAHFEPNYGDSIDTSN